MAKKILCQHGPGIRVFAPSSTCSKRVSRPIKPIAVEPAGIDINSLVRRNTG